MKAIWNKTIIADCNDTDTILIEGNVYFPQASIFQQFFEKSETHTTCPWKGLASYYTLDVDGMKNVDAAWYYSVPKDGSVERVGKDFANYIAFWKGVEIKEDQESTTD